MSDKNISIINLGELAEPAKVLIEKVSDAVGGIFKPYQIIRVAEAEAEAGKIAAQSKIEITEFQQRAMHRFMLEEANKQKNIESITAKAIPQLESGAQPKNVSEDWIVDFFDKSRLISDNEMQDLWAKVLAGEANSPGKYTKRTIHLLASLDKSDAVLFSKLCSYVWMLGIPTPLIFDTKNEIYTKNGINFSALMHLDSIGLICFDSLQGYIHQGFSKTGNVVYGSRVISLEFPKETENDLKIGHTTFTDVGLQLSAICQSPTISGMIEYALSEWEKNGVKEVGKTVEEKNHSARDA